MIHIIVGKRNTEFEKTLHKVIAGLGKTIDVERYDAVVAHGRNLFDELQTKSLFGEKKVFIVSGLFEGEKQKEGILHKIEGYVDAPNDLVILLESLPSADVKKLEKIAEIHKIVEKEKKEIGFNPFVLANTFGTGDKKRWIAFQRVLAQSDEVEPIHGMIWWKLKDMAQKKSVFTPVQLRTMAKELVAVYHESRLGGLSMNERLEKFFLTMPEANKK